MQDTQETRVQSLGQEDPLEKGIPTHSSILAWRIPWTEEPGYSIGVTESDTTEQLTLSLSKDVPSSPALRSAFPFLFDPQTQSPSFGSPGCWSCLWEGKREHQAVLPDTQKLSIPGPSGLWTAAFLSGFF